MSIVLPFFPNNNQQMVERERSWLGHLSSVFLVVEPSKIIFLIWNTIPQKEDTILLYSGTIVSPNKILLIWGCEALSLPWRPRAS